MKIAGRQWMIVALMAATAVIFTWPVIQKMGLRVAGAGGDPWQTMWRFEYYQEQGARSMKQGVLPGFIREQFLGGGEERLVNLSVWPWMPLHLIFGQPATYNIVWLLSYILSGYFMYLLVKEQGARSKQQGNDDSGDSGWQLEAAAVVAGLYYMLLPYHVAQSYGHFGAMQTQWLPLLVYLLLRWLDRPRYGVAVVLGLVFVLQAWTEHHYALWFAMATVVILIWRRRRLAEALMTKRGAATAALALVIGVGLAGAAYWPTIRLAQGGTSALDTSREQVVRFSADIFSYITPAPFQTLWGMKIYQGVARYFTGNIWEATVYLGIIPLTILISCWRTILRSNRNFWLVLGLLFLIISLGPRLHILGAVTPIPLPYAWLEKLPVISAVRAVSRAAAVAGMAAAVLLGLAMAAKKRRKGVYAAVVAAVMIEFMFWPAPTQSVEMSRAYGTIKEWPGKALVEIPAATNYTAASRALYASLKHKKDIIGSLALERGADPAGLEEIRSLPALRQLLYLRTTHIAEMRQDFFAQDMAETLPDVMKWLDAGGIAIQSDSLSPVQLESVRLYLEKELKLQLQKTDDIYLYRTAEEFEKRETDGLFLARDDGWKNVGYDPKRGHIFAEVPRRATVTIYNVKDDPQYAELSFEAAPESKGELAVSGPGMEKLTVNSRSDGRTSVVASVPGRAKIMVEFNVSSEALVIIMDPALKRTAGR